MQPAQSSSAIQPAQSSSAIQPTQPFSSTMQPTQSSSSPIQTTSLNAAINAINTNNSRPSTTIPAEFKTTATFNKPVLLSDDKGGVSKDLTHGIETDLLFKFLSDDILEHIISYTNEYAKSHCIKWNYGANAKIVEISKSILLKFIGIVFIMGMVKLPAIEDYFSDPRASQVFCVPIIWRTMSYTQFCAIAKSIHYDIDFLLERMNANFKKYYIPLKCVIVDEAMIPFKGRWRYRQHVRGKPHATGIKFFAICDSTGYLIHWWYYAGPDSYQKMEARLHTFNEKKRERSNIIEDIDETQEINVTKRTRTESTNSLSNEMPNRKNKRPFSEVNESIVTNESKKKQKKDVSENRTFQIVMDLLHQVPLNEEREYIVFADQFYGHCETVKAIIKEGHHACMTLQANRPEALIKKYMHPQLKNKGDKSFVVDKNDQFTILSYYDTKKCNFISTFGSVENGTIVRKNGKTPPEIVNVYNQHMHGVDKCDAGINLYRYDHRQKKYTNAIFYSAILKTAAAQAWRLDRCCWKIKTENSIGKNYLLQKKFLLAVALQLIESTPVYRISKCHYPAEGLEKKQCVACRLTQKKNLCYSFCKACNKSLCISCFESYHSRFSLFLVPALTSSSLTQKNASK